MQGIGIYGKENTGRLGAVNLNGLGFREGFVGIGQAASESGLTLLNPGTAEAALMVTGYNGSGEALIEGVVKIAAGSVWTGTAGDLLNAAALIGATHIRIASDVDLCGFETISTHDRMEMIPVMGRN